MRLASILLAAAVLAIAASGCSSHKRTEEMRCAACANAANPGPGDACMRDGACTVCHPSKCTTCGAAKASGHTCAHVKSCPDCGANHQCSNRCPTCGKEKTVCPDCGK